MYNQCFIKEGEIMSNLKTILKRKKPNLSFVTLKVERKRGYILASPAFKVLTFQNRPRQTLHLTTTSKKKAKATYNTTKVC